MIISSDAAASPVHNPEVPAIPATPPIVVATLAPIKRIVNVRREAVLPVPSVSSI